MKQFRNMASLPACGQRFITDAGLWGYNPHKPLEKPAALGYMNISIPI